MISLHVATARTPGAIAVLQLHGPDAPRILRELTGLHDWPTHRTRLANLGDIDEGLAALLQQGGNTPCADPTYTAHLTPHGGPRVVQRLVDKLIGLGCAYDPDPDPRALYPEAANAIEADVLHTIALAQSPAAIDLLAEQPARWQALLALPAAQRDARRPAIRQRAAILDRLIHPPTVVVAGPANVGKSTLTNALMGRAVSIVADLPGTTRDWVGGVVELSSGLGSRVSGGVTEATNPRPQTPDPAPEIAVRWLDTPGLRDSADAIEQRAIALARSVVASAQVLIAMRDPSSDWPGLNAMPRTPDLWAINKCDDPAACAADTPISPGLGRSPERPLMLSAEHGHGLPRLQHAVLCTLGLASLDDDTPWAFSKTLRTWADGSEVDLGAYLN